MPTQTTVSLLTALCGIVTGSMGTGCSPAGTTQALQRPPTRIARRAPPRTTCRVLLNLERGKVADVRIAPVLKVTLGHGTVLRHNKATYELWKRKHERSRRDHRYYIERGSHWHNLMARKLPGGRPFVLRDDGPAWANKPNFNSDEQADPKHGFSHRSEIWIQGTFGGLVSFYTRGSYYEDGMSHPSEMSGHSMVGLKGTAAVKTILSKASLRRGRQIWKAFLRHKDTAEWVKTALLVKDPGLWTRKPFWETFSLSIRFPAAPTHWSTAVRGKQFAGEMVHPSRWHIPGLFVHNYLPVGSYFHNHGLFPFSMRVLDLPAPLTHHVPRAGTTRVVAPDGCASVDLQTNEVILRSGRRHRLPGVTRIIGVAWIPGEDSFHIRQLKAAEIEAAPFLRRARQYQRGKQLIKAADHYLHGGRLLALGARYIAAAKTFGLALRLPFKRKGLRIRLISELGWAQFSAGRLDLASRTFDTGLKLRPGLRFKGALLYNLGRIAEQRGQLKRAISLYRSSLMSRSNTTVLWRLRRLIRRTRKQPSNPKRQPSW